MTNAQSLQAHGIKNIFTLVGGHISPILVACEKLGIRVVDTRHEVSQEFLTKCTVMILSFRTDMPGQTVQTQIRLLLKEQSDQGLHCLPFSLHRMDSLLYVEPHSSNFRVITTNFLDV